MYYGRAKHKTRRLVAQVETLMTANFPDKKAGFLRGRGLLVIQRNFSPFSFPTLQYRTQPPIWQKHQDQEAAIWCQLN